ncbi:Neuralized repeat (NHR) domain [Trinorchestia longiramus]|nr:Neuralized repeat (NHR) domain [Trinorchestia longiramus]
MRQTSRSCSRRLSPLTTTKVTEMPAICVEHALETRTVQCVNTGHILKRMKGLKKLKKKMGLAPRWSDSATFPRPPLLFHSVMGDNVRVSQEGTVVRRTQSFCKGIAFSNRPVSVNEKVCIRLLEVSSNWSGVLRFGFSAVNPDSMRGALPKYVCPDLTSRTGYWAKALSERYAKQGSILFFYANNAGEIIYGVDDSEIGVFVNGVDIKLSLWVVVDVYGNSTSLQFVDPCFSLNNREDYRRGGVVVRTSNGALSNRNSPPQPVQPYPSNDSSPETVTIPGFGNLRITDPSVMRAIEYESSCNSLPLIVHHNVLFQPLPFHTTKGSNISLDRNRTVAKRNLNEYCKGYVFTGRPLNVNEKIVLQVLANEAHYVGAMAFGVTSANPCDLSSDDLPEDCDELLDRSEYWVVCKDVAASPKVGDELSFTYSSNGQITFAKNNGSPHVIMHVDSSLKLYAFFDVFGHTAKLRMVGCMKVPDPVRALEQQHRDLQTRLQNAIDETDCPSQSSSQRVQAHSTSRNTSSECHSSASNASSARPNVSSSSTPLDRIRVGGSSSTSVDSASRRPYSEHQSAQSQGQYVTYQARTTSTRENLSRNDSVLRPHGVPSNKRTLSQMTGSSSVITTPNSSHVATPSSTSSSSSSSSNHNNSMESSECSVCYERHIDSVLYSCGHMCMCYTCAIQQWKGRGGGVCPICRAVIKDVIRTYRA